MLLRDEHVKRGDNEKSENRSDSHSANKHKTDRISCRSAGTGHECEWKVTSDSGDASHHNRAQTNARSLRDRCKFCHALPLQFVRELDNQDSVFRTRTTSGTKPDWG